MKKTKIPGTLFWIFIIAFLIVILIFKDNSIFKLKRTTISCLSYNDLINLTKQFSPNTNLYFRLQKQLNTPYIVNRKTNLFPSSLVHDLPPDFLRLAQWNIERGFNVNIIKNILSDKYGYYYSYKKNLGADAQFKKELEDFSKSDIISLNEVDVGMPRTDYKNVVSEIANALNYNYVFATEFIELTPIIYKQKVDSFRYLGLHGNAILSKYPIKSARIIRLPQYYDWYGTEIQKKSPLESARMFGAKGVFKEYITKNEVRRGGRNALIADIELPNREIITVVSTHLEDRCFPDKRFNQFTYLLSTLRPIRSPLILTGDFNTTGTDSAPTSVKKEFVKRIRDPHYLARQALLAVIPIGGIPGVVNLASFGLSKLIQYKDPSAASIPILFPNQEKKLFNYLKDFRFADGGGFDTSDDKSSNGKKGFLASSNERDIKGFESTFKFEEPRVIAYFKLDWFFVKPKGNRFKPFNGQTLQLINQAYPGRVSDHEPIIIDLNL